MTIEPRAEAPDDSAWPDDFLAAVAHDDIVAEIRANQDELIRAPLETVLVIEGGPGTGKTMTALQRVAFLIDEVGLDAGKVLVVGPSVAFARHTRDVLDSWGHDAVEHHAIDALMPAAATGHDEAPHVTRLKGEGRMARLLSRALEVRKTIGLPGELPGEVTVQGRVVRIDPVMLRNVIATARASEATLGDRRRILRAVLAAGTEDPRLVLAAADRLADMLWPSFEPVSFLRDLFASPEWLTAAAADEFTEREVSALYRLPPEDLTDEVWSDADRPLLDEAEHLLTGGPPAYAHVVVNHAQDLSPMQARAVARRSTNGSLTIVGDMAQSTGMWARDDWHDLLAQLPSLMPQVHRELRYGYRVPRQIFDLAAELLPTAAPSVQAPTTVRDGPAEPSIVPVDPSDRAGAVVAAAMDHVAAARTVGIICSPRCQDEIIEWLDEEDLPWRPPSVDESGPGIVLLTAHEAKGLEFEAAIVVEPGFIVDEDPRGHRLLYMALTRATSYMHLIGAEEDLPADFATPAPAPAAAPVSGAATAPAYAPATAPAFAPATAPAFAAATGAASAPATAPAFAAAAGPVSAPESAPAVASVSAPEPASVAASAVASVSAPGVAPISAPAAPSAPTEVPMSAAASVSVSAAAAVAPVSAPVAAPVSASVPAPASARMPAPLASPVSAVPASVADTPDSEAPASGPSAPVIVSAAVRAVAASAPAEARDVELDLAAPAGLSALAPVIPQGALAAPPSAAATAITAPPPDPEPEPEIPLDPATREAINLVAHTVAETLLANLTPELWPIALERVIELITPDNN